MKEQRAVSIWVPVVVMVGAVAVAVLGGAFGRPFGRVRDRASVLVVPSWVIPWLGRATVVDGVISAPRNLPPIRNEFSYALLDIDGRRITRVAPPLTDAWPEAIVRPGSHVFRVRATPGYRDHGSDAGARDEAFTATVERGKRYFICSSDHGPGLTEARSR